MIRNALARLILFVLLAAPACSVFFLPVNALAADPEPNWRLIEPAYPTADTFVAAYSVKDFGASGDGVTDVTGIFQKLLDALGRLGGGTLFVPEGRYAIQGTLLIPKGVTLRGEWSKPVKGEAVKGTILMAYAGRGEEEGTPFITMEPSSAVRDLAFWYPEQLPDQITPYPPTVMFGKPRYFGNDFCNAKNITFVNAYTGIMFSRVNGGSSPVLNEIYGTPLSRGIEIDNIADVGRLEHIGFSPDYWSGSKLPGAPAAGGAFEQWIYNHGTGIVMRRNDWSYTSYVSIEGYMTGFSVSPAIARPGSPNGHHYALDFSNCKTALYFEAVSTAGIMFTRVHIAGGENGVRVGPGAVGAIQLNAFDIQAADNAIVTDPSSKSQVLIDQSTIGQGMVDIEGGTLDVSDSDFDNAAPQIRLGPEARGIIAGNRFKKPVQIDNRSRYISAIDHTAVEAKKLPAFPEMKTVTHKPPRMAMYVATEAPFYAKNDGAADNTAALQAALDQAGSEGGGVVFLPPGKYKVLGHLKVPTGVELKGSVDNSTVPTGVGSIIEVYADKGKPSESPFLKLSAGSGLRGITFNYPEQTADLLPNPADYPYLIQLTGSDVYIVNVGMRAVYNGIDMFTYRNDNHVLDFVTGHVFHNGIKAGGGSTGGIISNLHFNPIVYAAGSETKFGSWPNSPKKDNKPVYDYGYNNLDFLVLGDVRNEVLYNDFHYGSARGVVLEQENGTGPSGISLGLGVDGAKQAMDIEAIGAGGFDFINSQIVSIGGGPDTRYIKAGPNFHEEASFYSSDYWGGPAYGVDLQNGKINFRLAHFRNPGLEGFAVLDKGSLNLESSSIGTTKALLNNGEEPRLSVRASIADPVGIVWKNTALWKFNLANYAIEAALSSSAQPLLANNAVTSPPEPGVSPNGKTNKAGSLYIYIIIMASGLLIAACITAVVRARSANKNG
jgi:hypothetical protein